MSNIKNFFFSVALSALLASTSVLACSADPETPEISVDEAIMLITHEHHNVFIVLSEPHLEFGRSIYIVHALRADDKPILCEVDVGNDLHQGKRLLSNLSEVLKTPLDQIIALRKAREAFEEDRKDLHQDLGVDVHDLHELGWSYRLLNNSHQRFHVTMKAYRYQTFMSASYLSSDFALKFIDLVPGKYDYPPEHIYTKGDLQNKFHSELKDLYNKKKTSSDTHYKHYHADPAF